MKTKIKRHSRSVISVILAVCMLVSCMTVGLIATDAANVQSERVGSTDVTIYLIPNPSWDANVYKANYQWQHDGGDKWGTTEFTLSSGTIGGQSVYEATFTLSWDGVYNLELQHYKGTTYVNKYQPVSNTWTAASTFNGKCWDGDSWETPAWDTPLGTPEITYNSSTANVSESAAYGSTAKIEWSAITNASSYTIYKDSETPVTGITNTYYNIPKSAASNGTYKVTAVPAGDDTTHKESAKSNGIQFTFTKNNLTTPSVSITPVDLSSGQNVTVAISNFASFNSTICALKLYRSGSETAVATLSAASSTVALTTTGEYYVKAEPKGDYVNYYNAVSSSTTSITVNSPRFYLTGPDYGTDWNTTSTTNAFSTYEGNNVYSCTIVEEGIDASTPTKYFRLTDGTNQYRDTDYSSDRDVTEYIGTAKKCTLTNSTTGAFTVTENGTFKFFIDQTSNEFWVEDNYWRTNVVEYTQDYGDDGNYTDVTESDIGGTASVDPSKVAKTGEVTLTATPSPGYVFGGWYTNTACTTPLAGTDTTLSQTYTPTGNDTIYALFQKERFLVTVQSEDTSKGTVTSGTVYSGSHAVTLPTANASVGYIFLNWTTTSENLTLRNINSADGGTVSATGTGTVTANFATKVTASAQVKGDGVGTVTVNGTANTKDVATGAEVTFVATPADNCSFYGWFTDADCTPANRVSTSRSFTTIVRENITYYALINFNNHKLWGHGALLHWGDGKADLGGENITFTQSSADPKIYTVKVDMKRTTNVAVSVDPGSPNTYQAASDGAGSNTAASSTRVSYDTATTNKWHVLGETDVKGLTFEWNSVTKKLKWTETPIDPNEYTVVYVKDNDYAKGAYVWSGDVKVFGDWPGAELSTFPTVEIGEDTYRVIYLTEKSFEGSADPHTFAFKINDNDSENPAGTEYSNLKTGKSYTIERTGDNAGIENTTTFGLTPYTLTVAVPKVNGDAVATATITSVNGVAQAAGTTSVTAYRGDDIEVTYVFNEGMEPKYNYDSISGVENASEASKVISFQMPNANTTAKVNFVEYDDTFYITNKAKWNAVKLHIWTNGGSSWMTTAKEASMSTSAQDWTELKSTDATPVSYSNHKVMYKYDPDKELYLVKGLSTDKEMVNTTYMKIHDGSNETNTIEGVKAGALYKTVASGTALVEENLDYENYDPFAVVWPPEVSESITTDATYKLLFNQYGGNDGLGDSKEGRVAISGKYKGTEGSNNCEWWFELPSAQIARLNNPSLKFYFGLSSTGNTDGMYGDDVSIDVSEAPLLNGSSVQNYNYNGFRKFGMSTTKVAFTADDKLGIRVVKGKTSNGSSTEWKYYLYTTGSTTNGKSKAVKIYAKDSTLRNGYTFYNKYATTNLTDSSYATTTPKYYTGPSDTTGTAYTVTRLNDDYDYTPAVPKGSTIYFKTVMSDTDMAADSGASNGSNAARVDKFRTNYYLKGYCINGTVYNLHTGGSSSSTSGTAEYDEYNSGLYKESFTIPEDWAYDYVEITPIYWLRETANTLVFYVQGYTDEVRNAGWGNTIGVYPFYQDEHNVASKGKQNAYGGYPGQPLVNYKGDLFAQIPVQYDGTNENNVYHTMYIKGITMSNMFWDYVHLSTGEVDKHHQTYDYDDLYKIYHEELHEEGDSPDNIICSFKYENKHNNDEPDTITVTEAGLNVYSNGWEYLTNFAGDKVDIFGNVLEGDELNAAPLYVISQDYRSNCAGRYATEWAVYNNDGSKVTTIVSSALILKDDTRFDEYDAETLKFKDEYQTLHTDTYMGRPVKITYEQSIWGGSDQAERCDARWYYSHNGESISATIKIQTSEDNGRTWTDAVISDLGVATVNGEELTAVFDDGTRYSESDLIHTLASLTLNKEEYFYFTATESTNYKFDSWQVERDGAIQEVTRKTGNNDEEKAPRSGNAVFIARFKHVVNNKFSLYHEVHPQSAGVGTVSITAQKYATGTEIDNVASPDGDALTGTSVTFDVANNETNVILATFTATPRADSTFDDFYETVSNVLTDKYGNKLDYILDFEIDAENNQFTVLYDIDKFYSSTTLKISSETFYSRFGFKERDYKIDYYFTTRKYGVKAYTVTGTINSTDAANSFKDQLATDIGFTSLNSAFVLSKVPSEESNFRQKMDWNSKDVRILPDEGTTLRAQLMCEQTAYNVCRAKIIDKNVTKVIETTFTNRFLINGEEYKASDPANLLYWEVYKWKGGDHGDLVAQCYGSSFNYTAYEDYYVVAVYQNPEAIIANYNRQEAYNSYVHGFASLDSVSRNHWNNNAIYEGGVWQINDVDGNTNGADGYDDANTEYDRLYADFFLGFDYNGIDLSQAQGYIKQYKLEKIVNGLVKDTSTRLLTVANVDNKNRVHCTLGIPNTAENADYNTKFRITPILMHDGVNVYEGEGKTNSIEISFNSIANSNREWVD